MIFTEAYCFFNMCSFAMFTSTSVVSKKQWTSWLIVQDHGVLCHLLCMYTYLNLVTNYSYFMILTSWRRLFDQVYAQLVACFSLLLGRPCSHGKDTRCLWWVYLEGIGKKWCHCSWGLPQYPSSWNISFKHNAKFVFLISSYAYRYI